MHLTKRKGRLEDGRCMISGHGTAVPARQTPLLFLEGVPEGRGSNMSIKIPCDSQWPSGHCRTPLLWPSATPSQGKRNWASAAAARSGHEKFIQAPTTCVKRLVSFRLSRDAKVE